MPENDAVSRRIAGIAARMRPDVPIFSADEIRMEGISGRWRTELWVHQTKEKAREDIRWLVDHLDAAQRRVAELERQLAAGGEASHKGEGNEQ